MRNADTALAFSHSCYESPELVTFYQAILSWLVRNTRYSILQEKWHDSVAEEILVLGPSARARSRQDLALLQGVIERILCRIELPETTIIVDALSECREAANLFNFLQLISQSCRIRVIILSRSIFYIKCPTTTATTIKMDNPRVESDVIKYAQSRIKDTKSLQGAEDLILQSVSENCSGLFLLTALLLDNLESADTHEDQLEILKKIPLSLLDSFEQLWLTAQSGLNDKQKATRLEIFTMLVVACRPLKLDEVSAFLSIDTTKNSARLERRLHDPPKTLEKLCRPFVSVTDCKVEVAHPAIRDFLVIRALSNRDSNADQAERCLSVLLQEKYNSVPFAAALLRKHLLPTGLLVADVILNVDEHAMPYEYAALHWQDHVVAVLNPSKLLLAKLAEFMISLSAVTWSERLIDIRGRKEANSINVQIDVRATLWEWVQGLPPAKQAMVPLDDFFIAAHLKVQEKLAGNDEEDHLLPYLPAMRLGQYYSIAGKSDDDFRHAYEFKKIVVDGFTKVLGKRSPLTLKARTEFINEFFSQELIAEAELELIEVVSIEKDVLGTESDAYYSALQLLGNAQYYLNKFTDASTSLQVSEEGLLRLLGEDSWEYQVNNLYFGWAFERQGDLEKALELYMKIITRWVPVRGKTNGLSIFAFTSVGSVYRKQQRYEGAKSEHESSWKLRQRLFSTNSNTTVDSGLQLALTYRDMELYQDALQLLDHLETSTVFENDFERRCQALHIRALIAFDHDRSSDAVHSLTRIIDDTTGSMRNQNNRECMWIRLTLASAFEHDGKEAEALMLFTELVKPLRPSSPALEDEPEPPEQLASARQALQLVRDRDLAGADRLLRDRGLQWRRSKDFYIRQGGPPADTAWVRPVKSA